MVIYLVYNQLFFFNHINLVVDIDCRLYVNCDPIITPNYGIKHKA